jgi:hypothetical protein
MIKKIIRNIQLYDGVWSIPLAFIAFFFAGKYSYEYFGDAIISTEYLQYVILTGLIMVFANFVVFLGLNFNFRSLQRYFYSKEIKADIKKDLTTWQRVKLYLLVYFGFLSFFLLILHLLMTVTA